MGSEYHMEAERVRERPASRSAAPCQPARRASRSRSVSVARLLAERGLKDAVEIVAQLALCLRERLQRLALEQDRLPLQAVVLVPFLDAPRLDAHIIRRREAAAPPERKRKTLKKCATVS